MVNASSASENYDKEFKSSLKQKETLYTGIPFHQKQPCCQCNRLTVRHVFELYLVPILNIHLGRVLAFCHNSMLHEWLKCALFKALLIIERPLFPPT